MPAVKSALQSVLSVYASGRGTALVLESGDGVTQTVPIFEGHTLPDGCITRVDVGGRDLTRYLARLLNEKGHAFANSADYETVRMMKENLVVCSLKKDHWDDSKQSYKLPDGQMIEVGKERFQCAEALFNPSLMDLPFPGLHEMVIEVLQKAPVDCRRDFMCNIVLSGGNTMHKGIQDRLTEELVASEAIPTSRYKLKVISPPERRSSTWIGGSILASLSTFQNMWISAAEYDEYGPHALVRSPGFYM